MSQFAFGVGAMYVTQLQDAWGNAISNPTPLPLLTLQEGSIDMSADNKELYGQNQYAAAVARGKAKLTVKVKPARIYAALWNALFFGQTLTSGLLAIQTDTTGVAIPSATPYTVTPTPPNTGTFVSDMGIISATGYPLTRVASGNTPATGQYTVTTGGTYTFAAADAGKTVYINYQYTVASANAGTAQMETVRNLPMGYAPQFKADLCVGYQGKLVTFSILQAIATKMSLGFKNEDFAIPEFDFSAMDNGTGNIMTWSTSE